MAGVSRFLGVASGAALGGAVAFAPMAVALSDGAAIAVMPTGHVGSGGVSSPLVVLASHRWSDSVGNVSVNLDAPMSADEQLAYVRAVLGVSITDLAELLNVARPTVYSWMQGTEPRGEHLERLQRLERQARDIEAYGLGGLGKLLKRPLQGGATLLELMKNNQPVNVAMAQLAAVARMEEKQRLSGKGGKVSATAAEAARDQSMPGYVTGA